MLRFGSRGMELIMSYSDQCAALYLPFMSGLFCTIVYILYAWYTRSSLPSPFLSLSIGSFRLWFIYFLLYDLLRLAFSFRCLT